MPFQSEKQRRYMHANLPKIAKRWERDYANGGILDINESEEIIDDGGNEIELTDYNAAFDDPNDLSTGVKSLFRAKEGGNVRLGPHTATDLLAKKNPDGTRSKYQPPGGGATSLGSGRDYSPPPSDRGPRDAPDRHGPTTETKTTGGDGYQDQIMKIAEQQKKTKETRETAAEQGWHQFITPRHITPTPKEKSFLDKLAWGIGNYVTGGALIGYNVPKGVLGAQKLLSKRGDIKKGIAIYNKLFDTDYDLDEFVDNQVKNMKANAKERKEKMDLYKSLPPGHPERIALEIELEIGKKPDHLGDDGGSPDLPQVVPISEEVQEYEQMTPDAGGTLASIRSKQALNAQLQAKWAAEQEAHDKLYMVANRGGLANLFRVKKQ